MESVPTAGPPHPLWVRWFFTQEVENPLAMPPKVVERQGEEEGLNEASDGEVRQIPLRLSFFAPIRVVAAPQLAPIPPGRYFSSSLGARHLIRQNQARRLNATR